MSSSGRDLDIVLWGATGFTGKLALAALVHDQSKFFSCSLPDRRATAHGRELSKVRFGVAGRNEEKLRAVLKDVGVPDPEAAGVSVFVANADDDAAIDAFVSRCRAVVATAGPFQLYSDRVVSSCVRNGTHFADCCGETEWVRSLIDRHHDKCRATGAVIVSMCGFDSLPFDLGALYAVNALRKSSNAPCRRVTARVTSLGSISGGSLATGQLKQKAQKRLTDYGVDASSPFLLGGIRRGGIRAEDRDEYTHSTGPFGGAGVFEGPGTMATINTRVVRRSAQLLGYGEDFAYVERNLFASEKRAAKALRQAKNPAPPAVIKRLVDAGRLPKPGQGPSPEVRKRARFATYLTAQAEDGKEVHARVSGGEAGYEETGRMVLEAGLALALSGPLPRAEAGGVFTPAFALGERLISRLHRAGILFEEIEDAEAAAGEFYAKAARQRSKM